tara:strand:+ start:1539 stop:2312 length:774 start_codon:yes stop_codon:yes gene_type:complete
MLTGIHFYNQTIKKAVSVFGTLFNNIKIVKPGKAETRVPIAYGPAQKFLARLEQSGADTDRIAIKLPRMSFEITSITYDAERALNKMNQVTSVGVDSLRNIKTVYQGVPYTIGFSLNVIGKDQDSCLQIIEQILPTFKPEYTVSIKDMETVNKSLDVPVILTGISFEDQYDGDYESRRTLIYTLEFEMKVKFTGAVVKSPIIKTAEAFLHDSPASTLIVNSNSPLSGVRVLLDSPTDSPNLFTAVTTFGFSNVSPSR